MSEIAALAVVRVAEIKNYSGKIITLLLLFAKLDALWKSYSRHYGKPGSILVAQPDWSFLFTPTC